MNTIEYIQKIYLNIKNSFLSFTQYTDKTIGIDLGTANTLIYLKGKGVVLNEPSVVAYISESGINVCYLYGRKAKMMLGKTPMKIEVIGPLADGVISDFNMAEEMIKKFLTTAMGKHSIVRPVVIVGVPLDATPVERRAIQETVEKCGVKEALLVYESMAAAIGAKLPVNQPNGCMVIDIGGGTTEISVISLGGIVNGKCIRTGGNKMDLAILEYIKNKYHLLIGLITAEEIKKTIGSVYIHPSEIPKEMTIRGRDLQTGTPKEIIITELDILEALLPISNQIIEVVKATLEISPPELASDIVDRGIVLCGGGSLIRNLDLIISRAVNLPVFIPLEPEMCVIRGIGKIAENHKKYDYMLFKQF